MIDSSSPQRPGADAFEEDLRAIFARGESDEVLIVALDKYQDCIESASDLSAACARRAIKVFGEFGRAEPAGFAWNLLVCAVAIERNWEQLVSDLAAAVDHSLETGASVGVGIAVQNAVGILRSQSDAREHLPRIVAIAERFFARFPDPDVHVDMLCDVAISYAAFRAFQPAYRAAGRAEFIAKDDKSLPLRARALETGFTVALEEDDFETALKWGKTLFKMYRYVKGGAPFRFIGNYAMALMNTGKYSTAIRMYERALKGPALPPLEEGALLVNLSVCYRKEGRHDDAARALERVRGAGAGNPELEIELELVSANNAAALGDGREVLVRTRAAAERMSAYLASATRLHYRRGMREAFLPRIEKLLLSIPAEGDADDLIAIVAECRSGLASDWLGLREWTRDVLSNNSIAAEDRAALEEAMDAIRNFGAPFLYGFREKYDDALDALPEMGTQPWDAFANVLVRLSERGIKDPYQHASGRRLTELLRRQVARGAWIFVAICPGGDHILVIGSGRYRRIALPAELLKNWWIGLDEYCAQRISRVELAGTIKSAVEGIQAALASAFDDACASAIREFWFLPNALDAIPFHAAALAHARVRDRMKAGELQVWCAPILYPGDERSLELRAALAVLEPAGNLPLAKAELNGVRTNLPDARLTEIFADAVVDFGQAMVNTDLLLVASHAVPLSRFTDPFFASMGGGQVSHCISFASLQYEAERWPCQVAILNACHSGASKAGNYQRNFKTHDLASYPVALMLNRRAAVAAAAWPTLESASCLFTHLFLQRIRKEGVGTAFAQAMAVMSSMSGSEANGLMRNAGVPNEDLKRDAVIEDMLHHPYCYGTFQLYGLFH